MRQCNKKNHRPETIADLVPPTRLDMDCAGSKEPVFLIRCQQRAAFAANGAISSSMLRRQRVEPDRGAAGQRIGSIVEAEIGQIRLAESS